MDIETLSKEVREQRLIIDQIFISVEKTRKYFLWTLIATVVAFVLPVIALAFVIPAFISSYTSALGGLGL